MSGRVIFLRPMAAVALLAALLPMVYAAPAPPNIPTPVIPPRTFRITDYGAVGDGKTMNTAALQKAIAACGQAGGGTVLVPPGRFLTQPITECAVRPLPSGMGI